MAKVKKKTKREFYAQKAEELVLPIIKKSGVELVDVEYVLEDGIYYLRVLIDKEGGITFEDCKRVNNPFSKLLDEVDFIEESYILEVGSPGLGRVLKKERDYHRNLGREIEIHSYQKINSTKKHIGLLRAWDADTVTLELDNGSVITIQRSNIALIREYVAF